ncbi:hypothetical protein KUTeg_016132 [Tegillarca granosa]|uniref:Thioredoxin-like protein AAED1 n=1 Tax=Tegillarca granosa TaxID=220873 RepID=A0ABQ9EJY8_TEGGR|nr:hypothetical protein KUTeg_016132 [Tegillarca granosa]
MDSKQKEKKSDLEEINDLKMSRGEKEEYVIDFNKLGNHIVYDENGNKIRFGDVYKHQKTIIVFTRHFLCFMCKDYVEDLAIIPLEYLQEANVRVVVIGPAPYKFIRYTLYTDPERELYSALKLKSDVIPGPPKGSKHVKQSTFMGILQSTWRAMKAKEYQGNIHQQGGAFIFGPGDVCHYYHIDQDSSGHAPINDLLEAAGVQQVSFPKDSRIQTL